MYCSFFVCRGRNSILFWSSWPQSKLLPLHCFSFSRFFFLICFILYVYSTPFLRGKRQSLIFFEEVWALYGKRKQFIHCCRWYQRCVTHEILMFREIRFMVYFLNAPSCQICDEKSRPNPYYAIHNWLTNIISSRGNNDTDWAEYMLYR